MAQHLEGRITSSTSLQASVSCCTCHGRALTTCAAASRHVCHDSCVARSDTGPQFSPRAPSSAGDHDDRAVPLHTHKHDLNTLSRVPRRRPRRPGGAAAQPQADGDAAARAVRGRGLAAEQPAGHAHRRARGARRREAHREDHRRCAFIPPTLDPAAWDGLKCATRRQMVYAKEYSDASVCPAY